MSEWISVDDRLPKKKDYNKRGLVFVITELGIILTAVCLDCGKWVAPQYYPNGLGKVIYWMKIPELPTKEEE